MLCVRARVCGSSVCIYVCVVLSFYSWRALIAYFDALGLESNLMSGFASDISSVVSPGDDSLNKALADGLKLSGEGDEADGDGDEDEEEAADGNDPAGSSETKKKKKKKPKKKKKAAGEASSTIVGGVVKVPVGEIRESNILPISCYCL